MTWWHSNWKKPLKIKNNWIYNSSAQLLYCVPFRERLDIIDKIELNWNSIWLSGYWFNLPWKSNSVLSSYQWLTESFSCCFYLGGDFQQGADKRAWLPPPQIKTKVKKSPKQSEIFLRPNMLTYESAMYQKLGYKEKSSIEPSCHVCAIFKEKRKKYARQNS